MTFGLSRLAQVSVRANQVDRATDFYERALGMKKLFSAPGMSFFDAGGVRLMVTVPDGPGLANASSVLYFAVDDIQAAHAALVARGVVFKKAPHVVAKLPAHDLWLAFFDDSEGNLLALSSEVKR